MLTLLLVRDFCRVSYGDLTTAKVLSDRCFSAFGPADFSFLPRSVFSESSVSRGRFFFSRFACIVASLLAWARAFFSFLAAASSASFFARSSKCPWMTRRHCSLLRLPFSCALPWKWSSLRCSCQCRSKSRLGFSFSWLS